MPRILLSILAVAAVAAIFSPVAWQAAPPELAAKPAPAPTFETRKVDSTDNVYIYRYLNTQAMFVVAPEGVIAT